MSTDRDVTRIVQSWLEEGVTVLPDRVLDAVLDQLPATHQRRAPWLARRFPTMNTYARLGLVAAAIVVAVVVGIGLFGRPSVGPAPEPTSSPTPSAVALTVQAQQLNVGVRYAASTFSVPFTFSAPGSGWITSAIEGPYFEVHRQANGFYGLSIMTDISVYEDPCHWDSGYGTNLQSLSTVDGIVAALTSRPGFTASRPVATTVGGYAGFAFDLAAPSDASGCTLGGKVRLLDAGGPDINDEFSAANVHLRYQIIDVRGTPVVLEHYSFVGATPLAEVPPLVDSITFP